jgi:hypothetical protein
MTISNACSIQWGISCGVDPIGELGEVGDWDIGTSSEKMVNELLELSRPSWSMAVFEKDAENTLYALDPFQLTLNLMRAKEREHIIPS